MRTMRTIWRMKMRTKTMSKAFTGFKVVDALAGQRSGAYLRLTRTRPVSRPIPEA